MSLEPQEARKALEVAISKVGRALGELLKVAEKHGDQIDAKDYQKARYFLDTTTAKLWDNIEVVRDIARATSGAFSLDSVDIDAAPATTRHEPQQTTVNLMLTDGQALARQIGGRLTRSARAQVFEQSTAHSVNTDLPIKITESSGMDDDDGVDFIDD